MMEYPPDTVETPEFRVRKLLVWEMVWVLTDWATRSEAMTEPSKLSWKSNVSVPTRRRKSSDTSILRRYLDPVTVPSSFSATAAEKPALAIDWVSVTACSPEVLNVASWLAATPFEMTRPICQAPVQEKV